MVYFATTCVPSLNCILSYQDHNQTKYIISAALAARNVPITTFLPGRDVWRNVYAFMIPLKERIVALCFLFLWPAPQNAQPAPRHQTQTTQERKNRDQFQSWTKMSRYDMLVTLIHKDLTTIKTYYQSELTSEIQDWLHRKNIKLPQWVQNKHLHTKEKCWLLKWNF